MMIDILNEPNILNILNILSINASELTETQRSGYLYFMSGMLLVMWALRRYGRKNKK